MRTPVPARKRIRWSRTFRVISARFPPIDLFERVADPSDWEALMEIEMLTNPRVRDEVGDIRLVSDDERLSGPGASWVMAAFTHIGFPSRFSDGTWGVYYAAKELETAVREKAFHLAEFFRATAEPLGSMSELRTLCAAVDARLHDIRSGFEEEHDPDGYSASQRLAHTLRASLSYGLVYRSVRHPEGQCLAILRPTALSVPLSGPHLRLRWDGHEIDRWFHFGDKRWRSLAQT